MKKPVLIGELLDVNIRTVVGDVVADGLDGIRVVEAWRRVIGPMAVPYSSGESYDSSRGGCLVVRISSSVLRHELFLHRKELIGKINAEIGRDCVAQLILR